MPKLQDWSQVTNTGRSHEMNEWMLFSVYEPRLLLLFLFVIEQEFVSNLSEQEISSVTKVSPWQPVNEEILCN